MISVNLLSNAVSVLVLNSRLFYKGNFKIEQRIMNNLLSL